MFRPLRDWLEDRTGIESAVNHFLYEEIPASSGWHQVFGSVAFFAFLVQAATGILLALNYAPAPGEAYDSVRYIMTQVTAGRLCAALHHWGASLMIVVVVLHMIQTLLWGAYKKPREATWIAGVVLLLLTLAFGLSGYLLPWDNRAYWGTVVTTQISALAPGAGPLLVRLLGSDGTSIGVITFTRFYVAHVQLLPPLTVLLIATARLSGARHGVAPAPEDENQPRRNFIRSKWRKTPSRSSRWFAVLMGMAILARVPLGHMADPTDLSYVPRPEWYFLFLFQFLKWFRRSARSGGRRDPSHAGYRGADITSFHRPRQNENRAPALGSDRRAALAAIFWGGLTARAVATTPESREMDMSLGQAVAGDSRRQSGFHRLFSQGQCAVAIRWGSRRRARSGGIPAAEQESWIEEHIKTNPKAPGVLTDEQVQMLVTFVTKRSDKAVDAWKMRRKRGGRGADLPGQRMRELPQAERHRRQPGSGPQRHRRAAGTARGSKGILPIRPNIRRALS